MSLDVYLIRPEGGNANESPRERIYVRQGGSTVEITREQWEAAHPGVDPVVAIDDGESGIVYEANITHNLGRMADEAGLYEALWRPEDVNATCARDLIDRLEEGLHRLRADRSHYEQWNPENGWGDYDLLVRFTDGYLTACREYPDAQVEVSR